MIKNLSTLCLPLLLTNAAFAQVFVYDNSTTYLDQYLSAELVQVGSPNTFELGDQIILGGSERIGDSFDFEYFGENLTGIEQVRVRFYANDGPLVSGHASPGTLLFDSGFSDPAVPLESDRHTIPFPSLGDGSKYTLPLTSPLPNTFTWSVQFTLGENAKIGPSLYSPPTVGNNLTDYWEKDGTSWLLRSISGGEPADFGARLTAVPEPLSCGLTGGALALLVIGRRWLAAKKVAG